MIYVIGSGPAGVSCALALLERGCSVQMLDGGITLEAAHQSTVDRLASIPPEEWDSASVSRLKSNVQASTDGLPRKNAFGSDYPYQQTEDFYPMTRRGVYVLPSLARGGLSTVWGAAILPFRAEELADWPITLQDLEPHYRAVLKFIPFSAAQDDLAVLFPLYVEKMDDLKLCRQSEAFLTQLSQNRQLLQQQGVYYGRSRLAVRAQTQGGASGCVYCGLCMYGCPYQCIYSSEQTLKILMKNQRFHYQKDIVVRRLQETAREVVVQAEQRLSREPVSFSASQVFLAGGILPTTQILLESLQAYNHPLRMSYSQHFMFPLLRSQGTAGVTHERLHTLSQIFLEIIDLQISAETIHLQTYAYNDLYEQVLKKSLLGLAFSCLPGAREWILGKLLIIQGYLHSRYSSPIEIRLVKEAASPQSRLILSGQLNSTVRDKVDRLLKKLSQQKKLLGAMPLSPLLKLSPPGQGFHNVGTFPMRRRPGPFETDALGRPTGFKRVSVVDATILPSAPATTITFSVMANAHRIGSTIQINEN